MQGDLDLLILNTINRCWREPVSSMSLVRLLRTGQPPGRWWGPVELFFTEAPVIAIERFCAAHAISPSQVQLYYERFIVPQGDRNNDLEAWFALNAEMTNSFVC